MKKKNYATINTNKVSELENDDGNSIQQSYVINER